MVLSVTHATRYHRRLITTSILGVIDSLRAKISSWIVHSAGSLPRSLPGATSGFGKSAGEGLGESTASHYAKKMPLIPLPQMEKQFTDEWRSIRPLPKTAYNKNSRFRFPPEKNLPAATYSLLEDALSITIWDGMSHVNVV